jgi:pimeloyl-ACP methyl ester carboxylesterase
MAVSPKDLIRRAEALRDGRRDQRAYWFFAGVGRPPAPTSPDGPDPYGNPDSDPEWLRIDWREHLRSVEIEGARVNYVEVGEGPAIVFVHGLAGCWQNWLENIPHFARSHRVLALDLPGFGTSPVPPWEISIPRYAELLNGFCRLLDVHSCVLVGNSMGGFISAEVSISEPDWVQKVVLVSAAGITHARMRKEPAEMAARMAAASAPLAFRFRESSLRRPRLRRAAFSGVFHAPHRLRPELLWEQHNGASNAPGFLPAVRALTGYDFTAELERVRDPTLIVWGRNDRIVSARDAHGYARHLANSRVVIFDRCGHCPQLERPVRFNRLVEQFLQEHGRELGEAEDRPTTREATEAETVE